MKLSIFVAAACAVALPAFAQEENTMTMEDAPIAALDAAKANANGVEFEAVQLDTAGGTAETYEFMGKLPSGMAYEVDVFADGTLEEIEEEIAMDALPAEVTAALEAELPGFAPTFIEKSTREGGAIVYEFEGRHEDEEIDVEINADGTNFVRNEDSAA